MAQQRAALSEEQLAKLKDLLADIRRERDAWWRDTLQQALALPAPPTR